jgi:hypothetical protein
MWPISYVRPIEVRTVGSIEPSHLLMTRAWGNPTEVCVRIFAFYLPSVSLQLHLCSREFKSTSSTYMETSLYLSSCLLWSQILSFPIRTYSSWLKWMEREFSMFIAFTSVKHVPPVSEPRLPKFWANTTIYLNWNQFPSNIFHNHLYRVFLNDLFYIITPYYHCFYIS